MNKKVLVIVFALLSLLAVVPTFAQDTMSKTIADIVVESASAATPEFSTLLAAVQAADPAVLETLANAELDPKVTVFAPTDAAFAALAEELGEEAFAAVLADKEALTSILLYHVMEGAAKAEDVVMGLGMFAGGFSAPTLNGQSIDVAQTEEGGVTVDGANVVQTDIEASNGVIHVIDAVILPETRTIAEIVSEMAADSEAPQFITLLTAVGAADPAVLETLSNPEAELTVFAPTDEAFAAVPADTLNAVLADQPTLTNILLYHVLPTKVFSYSILNDEDMLAAATGEDGLVVDSALEGAQLTVKAAIDDENGLSVTVNEANTVARDIDAVNGVIHVIDTVLLPPAS